MHFSVRKLIMTAAAAFLLVAALAIFHPSPALVLRDAETGKLIARYPLSDSDTFSVTFVHSVNQSPITDYYRRGEDNTLELFATKYHAYGAGIPESWPEHTHVETSENGIYVSNLNIILPDVTYIVGTVSDHTLSIGNDSISLRDLCGKNTEVLFKIS